MNDDLKLSDYLRSALAVLESLRDRIMNRPGHDSEVIMRELAAAEVSIRRVLHLVDGT